MSACYWQVTQGHPPLMDSPLETKTSEAAPAFDYKAGRPAAAWGWGDDLQNCPTIPRDHHEATVTQGRTTSSIPGHPRASERVPGPRAATAWDEGDTPRGEGGRGHADGTRSQRGPFLAELPNLKREHYPVNQECLPCCVGYMDGEPQECQLPILETWEGLDEGEHILFRCPLGDMLRALARGGA